MAIKERTLLTSGYVLEVEDSVDEHEGVAYLSTADGDYELCFYLDAEEVEALANAFAMVKAVEALANALATVKAVP